jgi:hypothetical protein
MRRNAMHRTIEEQNVIIVVIIVVEGNFALPSLDGGSRCLVVGDC